MTIRTTKTSKAKRFTWGQFYPYERSKYYGYLCEMYKRKIPPTLDCGLDLIGEVLYGKWKIRLLYFINEGHKRPSELLRRIPDASRRVLSAQLKELEQHELIKKRIYPQVPPKVEYSLTEFGHTLIPVINVIGRWGDKNAKKLRKIILNFH